jgi:hypothetical protein
VSSTTVQEIERAIGTLTSHELEEFCAWFDQYPHPLDTRIQADLTAGRLDRAIGDHKTYESLIP